MKAIFGILGLVVALAIVSSVAKKQLQALGMVGASPRNAAAASQSGAFARENAGGDRDGATVGIPGGMPGAIVADPNGLTVPQQARNMQEQARANTVRALEQGMQRNRQADR
jgi:hypothetical protein